MFARVRTIIVVLLDDHAHFKGSSYGNWMQKVSCRLYDDCIYEDRCEISSNRCSSNYSGRQKEAYEIRDTKRHDDDLIFNKIDEWM